MESSQWEKRSGHNSNEDISGLSYVERSDESDCEKSGQVYTEDMSVLSDWQKIDEISEIIKKYGNNK